MNWLRERWLDLCAIPTALCAIIGLAVLLPLISKRGPYSAVIGDAHERLDAAIKATLRCPGCGCVCDSSAVGDHAADCPEYGPNAQSGPEG